jgi:hypothetical protein
MSPLLPKHTASQLRQRVFQELTAYFNSLLSKDVDADDADTHHHHRHCFRPYRLSSAEIDSIDRTQDCGRFPFAAASTSSSTQSPQSTSYPAAILDFRHHDPSSNDNNIITSGGFSSLLAASPRPKFDTTLLAPHLIPHYRIRALFLPSDLSDIESEVVKGTRMLEEATRLFGEVSSSKGTESGGDEEGVWAIKSDSAALDFLVSLWRWRLWEGEGWHIDNGPLATGDNSNDS